MIVFEADSGTTLLERILAGHDEVADAGETYAFAEQMRRATDHATSGPLDGELLRRARDKAHADIGYRFASGLELGLADSLGELRTTLQERFGAKVRLPVIGPRRSLLSRFGLSARLDEIGPATIAAVEERLHRQRFGL